jgi:ABC-2 type transport system ATP-binding protein
VLSSHCRRRLSLVLEIQGLEKSYRVGFWRGRLRRALHPIDLSLTKGESFGYLGPNGSGKTTTLKLLMGLTRADAGTVRILGHPHEEQAWRYRVGYLPEHPYFYNYLTATEYLDYVGRLFGLSAGDREKRGGELLDRLGLAEVASVPLGRCSKGTQQRLGLAQALLNDPELVFLDEPMSGLDPLGRHLVRELIQELRDQGKTIFFSTHILSDAEALCDRVGLLRAGRLISVGGLDSILNVDVAHMEVLVSGGHPTLQESRPEGVIQVSHVGERWRLEVEEARLGTIVRQIEERGGRILLIQPKRQSLEEYFVERVGGSAGE